MTFSPLHFTVMGGWLGFFFFFFVLYCFCFYEIVFFSVCVFLNSVCFPVICVLFSLLLHVPDAFPPAGRKPRPGESWCPVCGVTLRPGELEAHLTHELDKLARLPQTRPLSQRTPTPTTSTPTSSSSTPTPSSSSVVTSVATASPLSPHLPIHARGRDPGWDVSIARRSFDCTLTCAPAQIRTRSHRHTCSTHTPCTPTRATHPHTHVHIMALTS